MREINCILLGICLFLFSTESFCITKKEAELKFAEGNEAYENGNHGAAIDAYELITSEFESPELYKNLGNAYFRSNNIALAILNYEKALKLNPRDEDVAFNLKHVNALTKDRLKELGDDKFGSFINSITNSFSANVWAYISLIMVFVFFIVLFLMFLTKKVSLKRSLFYVSAISAVLMLGSIYFGYTSKKLVISHNHCIIIDPKVEVKSEPNKGSTDLFILHEGSKVRLLESRNSWVRIQIPNGTKGWLEIERIKKI